jgi:hypothetical protein
MSNKEEKTPIFPFYIFGGNEESTFPTGFTGNIFTRYFETLNKNQGDSINFDISNGFKKIILQYIDELERVLASDSIKTLEQCLSDGLQGIDEDAPDEFICIKRNFLYIKESLLSNERPTNESVEALHRALKSDRSLQTHLFLLRYFGLNIQEIKLYFEKINSIPESQMLRQCFCSVGITGLRALTNEIIAFNFSVDIDRQSLLTFRFYCEVMALYIQHINDTMSMSETTSPGIIIHQLLRTAFYDGQLFRECQFYSEKSLAVMATVGCSHASRHATKPKKEFYARAVERCLAKINDPRRKKNRAKIIEEIAGSQEFKDHNLSRRTIADMIRTAIKKQKQCNEQAQ